MRHVLVYMIAGAFGLSGVHSRATAPNCGSEIQTHQCQELSGHSPQQPHENPEQPSSFSSPSHCHMHFCSTCTFLVQKSSEFELLEQVIVLSTHYNSDPPASGFQISLFRPPRA